MDRKLRHVLLLWLCTLCNSSHVNTGCGDDERRALVVFKNCSTTFLEDHYSLNSIWKGRDCCRWRGVGCSNATGHVESLSLPVAFGESESLNPPTAAYAFGEWTSLSLRTAFGMQNYDCPLSAGDLDYSLSRLKYLKHLDVSSGNFADVSTIPNSVGSLTRLTYLNLSNSGLSGTIPLHLGNLTNLQYLDLSSQGLTSYSLTWLSHLSSLRYIDLSGVNLTMAVDWPLVLHKLPVLSVLHLSDCGLANFPEPTANVSLITTLDLSENDFSYSTKLDRLLLNLSSSLVNLDLFSTNLKGSTLESLGRLSHLEFLDLGENSLQEWTPGILGNLCNLQILRLRRSSLVGDLSGVLPRCMSSNFDTGDRDRSGRPGPTLVDQTEKGQEN